MKALFAISFLLASITWYASGEQLSYGIYYKPITVLSETPTLSRLQNKKTKGITGCVYMYASKLDRRHNRAVFQYVMDYFVDGFTVELVATDPKNPKLNIFFGGSYVPLKVDFPIREKTWTQLCVSWNQGEVMVYKDGKQLNPAKRLQLYNALHYPATKSSAFVLGQRSGDLNLKRGLDSYYKAFQGYLSGMYLWERALSSEEIAQVHQKNTPMDNLVVRWNDFANIRRSGSIRLFTFRGRNECRDGSHECDVNADCIDKRSGYDCRCKVGFFGDGKTCTDVNECATDDANRCHSDAECTNTVGSYTCACKVGYQGDGFTCQDVDECAANLDNCNINAECTNSIGSFSCACNIGYSGDGVTCEDVNECSSNTHICDKNAACSNNIGSYSCACNVGYRGDGYACADIDECKEGTHRCHNNAACTNNIGSYACACNIGYRGDGYSCADIDECILGSHRCDKNAACTNNIGSYSCACNNGYKGDGYSCADVDECILGSHRCDKNAACTNNIGSYSCACNNGYKGDGYACLNVNECLVGTHTCDKNAACSDVDGSFSCSCNVGYRGDGYACADIDECQEGTHLCHKNAACTNNIGSYACACKIGYQGDGFQCGDTDECYFGSHRCDGNAACANNDGSYSCACNDGFQGDGFICDDVDECTVGSHNCDVNARCSNSFGSFSCACNDGYRGSGRQCDDVDECTEQLDNCHSNADCANSLGSFTCKCKGGYQGNGVECSDIDECALGLDTCQPGKKCVNAEGSYACRGKEINFAIDYTKETTQTSTFIKRIRNKRSDGIAMCTWYKLTQVVNGKTLFQYTLDYTLDGFQVSFLAGSGLTIRYGGSKKLIIVPGISTKLNKWTHLCVSGKKEYVYVYVNGQMYNRYRSPDVSFFPANSQSSLLLGQETSDPNIQYGIRRRVKAFVGSISHFFLYAGPITDAEVRNAYNKIPSERNLLVGWDQFAGKAKGGDISETQFKKDQYPF